MQKKIVSLVLIILTVLSIFGCSRIGTPGDATKVDETSKAEIIRVVTEGVSEYSVIRPERADEVVVRAAVDLYKGIESATGVKLKLVSDWHKKEDPVPESAKEIVVGKCDRPETEELLSRLREKDFAISYANGRVYILGGSDSSTAEGVKYFLGTYADAANKSVSVTDDLFYLMRFAYPLPDISIKGVGICEYTIVIPAGCDLFTKYAAQNLSDCLKYKGGVNVATVTDSAAPAEYEILVGVTNRPESAKAASVSLGEGQYVLAQIGKKIVMQGKSYMVGGAVSAFINEYAGTGESVDITDIPSVCGASTFRFEKPDSALLMIGDGMGFNHVKAAIDTGKIDEFVGNMLPNRGDSTTYSYSVKMGVAEYTDSAAAGTALATAHKTLNNYLGVNFNGKNIKNIRELAYEKGAKTAILTTDVITGATPAAFLVHVNDRKKAKEIGNAIDELLAKGEVDYAISSKDSDDILNRMPEALWGISAGDSGYFSMIEAAYIDKEAHKNRLDAVTDRVRRYNDMLSYTLEFTICHPKSVMLVTADHECGGLKKQGSRYFFTSNEHTNANVPVYAIGYGTEIFNKTTVDNTDLPKFMAKIFGDLSFGG